MTCTRCGELRVVKRSTFTNPVCDTCRRNARTRRKCVECGELNTVHCRLLHGPVCTTCYSRMRDNPSACYQCGEARPLIGRDAKGNRLCGPCNGDPRGWICRECGQFGVLFADQRCRVCVAKQRVRDRLSDAYGVIHPQLTPVLDLLDIDNNPKNALSWLASSAWGKELGVLARQGDPISHDLLDSLPPRKHVAHLRAVLVYAGVLADRDEAIEGNLPWLEGFLANEPASIAAVLRPYATWSVLRRARQRAHKRTPGRGTTKYIRNLITLAAELMVWSEAQGVSLCDISQLDIDRWLAEGGVNRQRVRDFLRWAAKQHLMQPLRIPVTGRLVPDQFMPDSERWAALHRCACEQELDLQVRVSGALVLLFGLTPTRIMRLTPADVQLHGKAVSLKVGASPLLIPGSIGILVQELAAQATARRSRLLAHRAQSRAWLFPGIRPGQHATADIITKHIATDLGVRIRPARNAALCALAQDIPSPVLAEVLGLRVEAVERWRNLVSSDWSEYLAARDTDAATHLSTAQHVPGPFK